MDINELIALLMEKQRGQSVEMKVLLGTAAGTIENLLGQVDALKEELRDERHRHDRYVDFELAEAEELRKLKEQMRWIPANDPPKEWKDENGDAINFLIFTPDIGVDIGNWIEPAKSWFCFGVPFKVTHWMPLPEPPKGE